MGHALSILHVAESMFQSLTTKINNAQGTVHTIYNMIEEDNGNVTLRILQPKRSVNISHTVMLFLPCEFNILIHDIPIGIQYRNLGKFFKLQEVYVHAGPQPLVRLVRCQPDNFYTTNLVNSVTLKLFCKTILYSNITFA